MAIDIEKARAAQERRNARKREVRAMAKVEPHPVCSEILPSPDLTAVELISRLKEDFTRIQNYEERLKLVSKSIDIKGPIGILAMGDPHCDDAGCDWPALDRDIQLVRNTTGLYAGLPGDMTNNWIGKLAHLWSQQSTTAKQAIVLGTYIVEQLAPKLLYMVAGNHNCWSGDNDPFAWIAQQNQVDYQPHEVRMTLKLPECRLITMNIRHDFKGGSMWNPIHSIAKAFQMGHRDDIIIGAHKHMSAHMELKDPDSDRICNLIQVASYKRYDDYAKKGGFKDQHISPCGVIIIDPYVKEPNRFIKFFWSSIDGAEYLTFLRKKYGV